MILHLGIRWITADEARETLGPDITPEMLRDWARRGLVTRVPVREGRTIRAYYREPDLIAAEAKTRQSSAGRPRATGSATRE